MAPERAEIERHLRGVAEQDTHAPGRHVELLRDELRESGPDALAELDLSRERDDGPVGLDADALAKIRRFPHVACDAARFVARITRPYAPQRQRLLASASRIVSS